LCKIIAVIDDVPLVRESVQRLVSSMGFQAEQFSSLDDFFASDACGQVQCIISDIGTDGCTGERLHQGLTSRRLNIPVIFMTALPVQARDLKLLEDGAIRVLSKPFHATALADCIRTALAPMDCPYPP
jgi:FixJ family two-component response regulator